MEISASEIPSFSLKYFEHRDRGRQTVQDTTSIYALD